MDELLSGEVAKRLGVHPITVTRLAQTGKLRYRVNAHGWKLFREADVNAVARDRSKRQKENNHD